MTDQVCKNCGKENAAGESYCLTCGMILPAGQRALQTQALPNGDLTPELRWGTAYFGEDTLLRMRVRDSNEIIQATFGGVCVIGRSGADNAPDIDLKEHSAAELGVSREHVRLRREISTVMVEDLGSRNGTFLNGDKLVPYQPRVLRNGDELRLGHLVVRVSFTRVPKVPGV